MATATSALDAMMTALVTTLTAGGLTASGFATGGLYDAVPAAPTYPYAVLTLREDPEGMHTFGRFGVRVDARLRVFDDYEGHKRIDAIVGKAALVLHQQPLTVTGFNTPHVQYRGAVPAGDAEVEGRVVRQKVAWFEAWVEVAA